MFAQPSWESESLLLDNDEDICLREVGLGVEGADFTGCKGCMDSSLLDIEARHLHDNLCVVVRVVDSGSTTLLTGDTAWDSLSMDVGVEWEALSRHVNRESRVSISMSLSTVTDFLAGVDPSSSWDDVLCVWVVAGPYKNTILFFVVMHMNRTFLLTSL